IRKLTEQRKIEALGEVGLTQVERREEARDAERQALEVSVQPVADMHVGRLVERKERLVGIAANDLETLGLGKFPERRMSVVLMQSQDSFSGRKDLPRRRQQRQLLLQHRTVGHGDDELVVDLLANEAAVDPVDLVDDRT